MLVCIGEILADMIGEEKNGITTYERKAGGAPFNVACALKKFGADVKFVGSVGDDLIGRFLIKYAKDFGMDVTHIQENTERNTTLAFVELNEEGERSFCFYRKNTADYYMPRVSDELIKSADIICMGSLMLADSDCVKYALDIIERAHGFGKTVAFDVNYRTDIFRDKESAVQTYKKVLAVADIVKFSEDEVETFTQDYVNSLSDKLVLITLGKDGSEWRYKGKSNRIPTITVNPIDTTGAGDAFFAGALSVIDKYVGKPLTEQVLNDSLRFGNVAGALNTTGRGAIDNLPDLDTINKYINI
ncbi:MAG: carbohydrate kinase [Ruminococcaceae bacterium]|nr:carbohydrate kinase [Oscillospiraceae bacterium]